MASSQKPAEGPQPEPSSPADEEELELVQPNSLALLEDIRSEFQIDKDGKAFASRKAIARLTGVQTSSIVRLLTRVAQGVALEDSKTLEPIAGQDFQGVALIPDTAAACIIAYYAMDAGRYCTAQAKQAFLAFSAIGFRTWVQHELGWQPSVPNPGSRGDILREMAAMADEVDLVKAEQAEIARRHAQLEQAFAEWVAKQQAAGQHSQGFYQIAEKLRERRGRVRSPNRGGGGTE